MATIGLSSAVSGIDGDFSRQSQNFPTHFVFCIRAEGVSLGIGYTGTWDQKNCNDGDTEPTNNFDDIISCPDTIHQGDGETDGQTDEQTPATANTALYA